MVFPVQLDWYGLWHVRLPHEIYTPLAPWFPLDWTRSPYYGFLWSPWVMVILTMGVYPNCGSLQYDFFPVAQLQCGNPWLIQINHGSLPKNHRSLPRSITTLSKIVARIPHEARIATPRLSQDTESSESSHGGPWDLPGWWYLLSWGLWRVGLWRVINGNNLNIKVIIEYWQK